MQKLDKLGNIEYDEKDGSAVFTVDSKIYPLDVVYLAAYVCMDRMYIIFDGNPENKIRIEIRKKDSEQDVKKLVMDFNEELLNYLVYKNQSEKNRTIRETMLQRILLTNSPEYFDALIKQNISKEAAIEDPLGIMKPWEETHKKDSKNAKNKQ